MLEKWRTEEDNKIDKKFNIERKPTLGCLISIGGTILVWSLLYWFYLLISS